MVVNTPENFLLQWLSMARGLKCGLEIYWFMVEKYPASCRFEKEEEAISIANNTNYGLASKC